ncbi:glutathione S-transferase family protein [Alteraurantiacibacter aestuarii]|uniref:glutathione S-transferase family protein n=1 Tax=Alteraurantiacibacter aestuarii TaxID=650004 RepID=UPI0031CF0F5B
MQIFGFPTSPYVRKAMVIAAEKGADAELVEATPHKPTPEFLAASPFRMMPAMQDGDFTLPDSTAIAFYLDAKYPQPPLLPADPQARGRVMWLDEFADTILSSSARGVAFNRYIGPALLGLPENEEAAAAAEATAHPALDYLEDQMPEDGWLVGEYSLADIAVASCLKTLSYGLDVKARPRTAAWLGRMEARPAWRAVAELERDMIEGARISGAHRSG